VTSDATDIGQKIRRAREAKNWTQPELAEKVGVSKQTVSRWETGDDEPRWSNVMAVGEALGLPPTWFLPESREGDQPESEPSPLPEPLDLLNRLLWAATRMQDLAGRGDEAVKEYTARVRLLRKELEAWAKAAERELATLKRALAVEPPKP
jgi:transcriptional regulator with XRE-family HTH domain